MTYKRPVLCFHMSHNFFFLCDFHKMLVCYKLRPADAEDLMIFHFPDQNNLFKKKLRSVYLFLYNTSSSTNIFCSFLILNWLMRTFFIHLLLFGFLFQFFSLLGQILYWFILHTLDFGFDYISQSWSYFTFLVYRPRRSFIIVVVHQFFGLYITSICVLCPANLSSHSSWNGLLLTRQKPQKPHDLSSFVIFF
jgi:hypothetical protein